MTVLRPLEFVNLPSREAMDVILCVCFASVSLLIGTILYQTLDFGMSTGLTLRTMAKCSVRISLSTTCPLNLVVILSRPFCRSRFVSVYLCIRCTALARWNYLVDSHVVLIPKCVTLFHHTRWRRERGFWRPIAPEDQSFQYLLFQLVERHLVCCQDLFASNLLSSWIVSLKFLPKVFRGRSCLPLVDMETPEITFVSHCVKFVMFLVHILCLCFLLSSAFCLRSCGASCFEIASRLICLPCFS